ncbi:MAG TPA: hypothetical protein VM684_14830 [Gaiellales bacterium]|nr:hypothetical protein [Gaiellales bacterium]
MADVPPGQDTGLLADVPGEAVAVSRWAALARPGAVPPVDRAVDAVPFRYAHRIREVTERAVQRRLKDTER